jgi:hypothetical protein
LPAAAGSSATTAGIAAAGDKPSGCSTDSRSDMKLPPLSRSMRPRLFTQF